MISPHIPYNYKADMSTIQNKSFCPKYDTICVVNVWLSTIFLPPYYY